MKSNCSILLLAPLDSFAWCVLYIIISVQSSIDSFLVLICACHKFYIHSPFHGSFANIHLLLFRTSFVCHLHVTALWNGLTSMFFTSGCRSGMAYLSANHVVFHSQIPFCYLKLHKLLKCCPFYISAGGESTSYHQRQDRGPCLLAHSQSASSARSCRTQ